jgi:hypothetical protein
MVEFDTKVEASNLLDVKGQEREYFPDESLRKGK